MSTKGLPVGLNSLDHRVLECVNDSEFGTTRDSIKVTLREEGSKVTGAEVNFSLQKLMGQLPGHTKVYVTLHEGRYHLSSILVPRMVRAEILEIVRATPQDGCANHFTIMDELVRKKNRPQDVVLGELKGLCQCGLIRDEGGGLFLLATTMAHPGRTDGDAHHV